MLASISLLLVLAHNLFAQPSLPNINAVVDGEVVLSPVRVSGIITEVTWKHNNDIALEWFGEDITPYREFKGRTVLDKRNGNLTIKNLIPMLSGLYTAELNNQIVSVQQVKIFDPVPVPNLIRTYDERTQSNVFTCDYNAPANAQPVELRWKIDGVEQPGIQAQTIQGNKNCSFVCELTNPVSKYSSNVVENTSCKHPLSSGQIIGIVMPVVLVFLAFILFVVIFVIKPSVCKDNTKIAALQNSAFGKTVDGCFSTSKGNQDGAAVPEHTPMVDNKSADKSAKPGANGTSDFKQEDEKSAPQ